jgi:hypothetical protein
MLHKRSIVPTFHGVQAVNALEQLRQALMDRKKRIIEEAFLVDVVFEPVQNMSFVITASWSVDTSIDGGAGTYSKKFSRHNVLMPDRYGLRYKKKFCAFADDIVRDILRARGVVK